jgi:hypothetical protein
VPDEDEPVQAEALDDANEVVGELVEVVRAGQRP